MTRQERALDLRKRGYAPNLIAELVGWDIATALRFFNSEEVKELLTIVRDEEALPENDSTLTKQAELDNLDDRLAIVEHQAISSMIEGLKTATLNDARRTFESIGNRRVALSKQTGQHQGDNLAAQARAVVVNINTSVMAKLVKNNHNQIIEVDGRELKTLDRDSIKQLTQVDALDKIEAMLE